LSGGNAVTAPALSDEAVRLTRWLRRLLPDEPEVAGLLALMLLTDARRPARTAQDGVSLVPLAEQDRSHWDRAKIDEGTALITAALAQGSTGRISCRQRSPPRTTRSKMDDTDWRQILGLCPVSSGNRWQDVMQQLVDTACAAAVYCHA
jgi:predicted RNA polymerase sigma factor